MPPTKPDMRSGFPQWKSAVFLIASALLLALVALTQWIAHGPDFQRDTPPIAASAAYSSLVDANSARAKLATTDSLERFRASLAKVNAESEGRFALAAERASHDLQRWSVLLRLLATLAWDKVSSQNKTDEYLNEVVVAPAFDPAALRLQKNVGDPADQLQSELRKINTTMALELAAPAASAGEDRPQMREATGLMRDLRKPLDPLMHRAVGDSVVLFDVRAIVVVASSMFAKQVTRLAAATAVAGVDGPLPIADVISVLLMIWTARDLYHMRSEFGEEVRKAVYDNLQTLQRSASERAVAFAEAQCDQALQIQAELAVAARKPQSHFYLEAH